MRLSIKPLFTILFSVTIYPLFGQLTTGTDEYQNKNIELNTITTAVPFVLLSGNAYQMGVADIGVVCSNFYSESAFSSNAALLANGHEYTEIKSFYSPWLRALVNDMNLFTFSTATSINKHNVIGLHYKYFSLGSITFTDESGTALREFTPREMAIQLNYAHWFNDGLSFGLGTKFINSNLTGGIPIQGAASNTGRSIAIDLGLNYRKHNLVTETFGMSHSFGLGINNVGSKMSYTETAERDFIPTNLKLGALISPSIQTKYVRMEVDIAYQATKLLVPTPATYHPENETLIASGKDSDVDVFTGIIQSFSDAPGIVTYTENDDDLDEVNVESGSVFKEELREINHSFATELRLVLNERVSLHLRNGYFYESPTKGNRQFISVGAGLSVFGFRFDFANWFSTTQQNPLANTRSISLGYRLNLGSSEKYNTPSWSTGMD